MARRNRNVLENQYPLLPLDPAKRQIRLLRLHRWGLSAEIRADLQRVSLDDEPVYEALSYTWGSSTKGHTILLNNSYRLRITNNLHGALQRFRKRSERPWMWIDAVCINQTEIIERNNPVAMMGDIYRSAQRVCVWMGEPKESFFCHLLIVLFGMVARKHDFFRDKLSDIYRDYRQILAQDAHMASEPRWASRAWVQQEYALARSAFFCFGSFQVPRNDDAISGIGGGLRDRLEAVELLQSKPDLITAMDGIVSTRATDPRDLVYSLLGIINPAEAELIHPDYSAPFTTVFAQATYACIRSSGSFGIMEDYGHVRPSGQFPLPSWAIDFSNLRPRSKRRDDDLVEWPRISMSTESHVYTDDSYSSLQIQGVYFDTIAPVLRVRENEEEAQAVTSEFIVQRLKLATDCNQQSNAPTCDDIVYAGDLNTTTTTLHEAADPWNKNLETRAPATRRRIHDFLVYARYASLPIHRAIPWNSRCSPSVFVTTQGYLAFAPDGIEPDDQLVLGEGASLPFILRSQGESWTFQGFAWVFGIHNGQLLDLWKDTELEYRTYRLV